jgi:hypothetical protein
MKVNSETLYIKKEAVSKARNLLGKVILNLFQDLIINGLRCRTKFGMTHSRAFETASFVGGEGFEPTTLWV